MSITITQIEREKGTLYRLYLDDGRSFCVDVEVIYFNKIKAGSEWSIDQLEQLVLAEHVRQAKARAMYLLGIKDYSCSQMRDKLSADFMEQAVEQTVQKLVELGYLDDERYAEKLARYCLNQKKWGHTKAVYYIRQKGISLELARTALSEVDVDLVENITSIIEKKYINKLGDYKQNQKVIAALARLGYNYSDIKTAIQRYTDGYDEYN